MSTGVSQTQNAAAEAPWPVRVINLERSRNRFRRVSKMLDGAGLAFERRRGVDASGLPVEMLADLTRGEDRRRYKRALTPGEIGCYLAHVELWSEIAAADAPGAVVFEDDVTLVPDAKDRLSRLVSTSTEWDLLKLCYGSAAHGTRVIPRAVHRRRLPPATLGYAITRPAARRLAEHAFPLSRPVDLMLRFWWEHGLAIAVADPPIGWAATGHDEHSAISPEREDARNGAAVLRAVRNARYQISRRFGSWRAGPPPTTRQIADDGASPAVLHPVIATALDHA